MVMLSCMFAATIEAAVTIPERSSSSETVPTTHRISYKGTFTTTAPSSVAQQQQRQSSAATATATTDTAATSPSQSAATNVTSAQQQQQQQQQQQLQQSATNIHPIFSPLLSLITQGTITPAVRGQLEVFTDTDFDNIDLHFDDDDDADDNDASVAAAAAAASVEPTVIVPQTPAPQRQQSCATSSVGSPPAGARRDSISFPLSATSPIQQQMPPFGTPAHSPAHSDHHMTSHQFTNPTTPQSVVSQASPTPSSTCAALSPDPDQMQYGDIFGQQQQQQPQSQQAMCSPLSHHSSYTPPPPPPPYSSTTLASLPHSVKQPPVYSSCSQLGGATSPECLPPLSAGSNTSHCAQLDQPGPRFWCM